jgi:hypothetical protein
MADVIPVYSLYMMVEMAYRAIFIQWIRFCIIFHYTWLTSLHRLF